MKKTIAIILTIATLITVSAVVYAQDLEFNDLVYRGEEWKLNVGVYRGEKWDFVYVKPEDSNIIILQQDGTEQKEYEIIVLDD